MLKRLLIVLTQAVLLVIGLIALTSIASQMLDRTPSLVADLAKVEIVIEARTGRSFEQSTDVLVVCTTLILLIGRSLLAEVTNFFRRVAAIVIDLLTGERPPLDPDKTSIWKLQWLFVPVMVWAVSIAIVHAFA